MRLEDHVNFVEPALSCRQESRLYLCGMVPVIIHHTYARNLAAQMKAPVHTAELIESGTDRLNANVEPNADRYRRCRVQDIVHAGHMQRKFTEFFLPIADAKAAQRMSFASETLAAAS